MKRTILVLSQSGLALARRLRAAWPDETTIYGPSCVVGACDARAAAGSLVFPTAEPGVWGWVGPLRAVFPTFWAESEAIVAVMALGIVVRLAGPLATDKRRDPAVVVVDDAGRFAISVLGGHGAGANELAVDVAALLGATAVVTTASEAQGLPAVDRIGRALGWAIERRENLTRVAAAVVRRETVAVWQEAGPRDAWWRPFGHWPAHFVRFDNWDGLAALDPAALLVISDRIDAETFLADRTVVYRPPTLVAGIGCKRGTPAATIAGWVEEVLGREGWALGSVSAVATVTLKADEPGLLAYAESLGVPLIAFTPDELDGYPGIETPSDRVRGKIGIAAVAEPSALRASGAARLLVPKRIGPGVTVALARRPEAQ